QDLHRSDTVHRAELSGGRVAAVLGAPQHAALPPTTSGVCGMGIHKTRFSTVIRFAKAHERFSNDPFPSAETVGGPFSRVKGNVDSKAPQT
ncbi:MAG: hypothetical protein M0Z36_13435, partial [Thermaerobacter sp.]|nr:hypothetical protein [Thermaerobacter sp.]